MKKPKNKALIDNKAKENKLNNYKLKTYAKVLGSSQSTGMTRLYMAFTQQAK